jgi:ARG and Rhodanese-Phosphatase-superfamily-associated Protein domain
MDPILATLDTLEIGEPLSAANLTMFPLLVPQEAAPAYLTLDEALAGGLVSVTEVSESGSVPELLVKNLAPQPVLVLDGEELVGAKQNRIVNLSILVPARETLHIPVSCVEAGRWARRSREFAAAGRAHYAAGRAKKLAQVSLSLRSTGTRAADQSEVWYDIDRKAERMKAKSVTSAAAAMYEKAHRHLEEFQERLEVVPRQAGAIFTINGIVAGVDLFDSPATWRKSMRKLVQSYGLDALDRTHGPVSDARPQPKKFLKAVQVAPLERFKAIGLGEDIRINGKKILGGALVADGRLVHLVAFPAA